MRGFFACVLLIALPAAGQDGCDEEEGGCTVIEVGGTGEPDEGEAEEAAPPTPPPAEPPKPAEAPRPPALEEITPQRVNEAIDRGIAWLKQAQGKDGSWGPCTSSGRYDGGTGDRDCYHVGPTSFAIFTLAKCGVPVRDKVVRKGLKWLEERCRKARDQTGDRRYYAYSTYESASVILMLTALYAPDAEAEAGRQRPAAGTFSRPAPGTKFDKDDWQWMHERLVHLLKGQGKYAACQNDGGGWRYWQSSGDQDLSATQFCLLALRAAARAGYPVTQLSDRTYEHAALAAQDLQLPTGAFRYHHTYAWSAGMTTAGIASLLICKEQMALAGQSVPDWIDPAVEKGLEYLGTVFDVEANTREEEPPKLKRTPGYHYYYLYGIERVGALSGCREIGGKAWYPRGAAYLLGAQDPAGFFDDPSCMRPRETLGTCFALLFLKRATPPPAVTITGD